MVRTAKKLCSSNAAQVRWTCSMQGLKAQKTPSGLRHCAAEATAYMESAIHDQGNAAQRQCVVSYKCPLPALALAHPEDWPHHSRDHHSRDTILHVAVPSDAQLQQEQQQKHKAFLLLF